MNYFIQAIKNNDTTLHFPKKSNNRIINELHQSLNELNEILHDVQAKSKIKETYFSEILQHIATGVIVLTDNGFVTDVNSTALELTGLQTLTHISQLKRLDSKFTNALSELKNHQKKVLDLITNNERIQVITRCTILRLEKEDVNSSVKQAAVMALSTTNLPQAAEVLARHFLTIQGCRSALIRMGELAVPALAGESARENAIQCILALREIGTPSAAEAIVPHLGDTKDDIALVAAWSLGNLMQSKGIEEALRNCKSTIPSHLQKTLDWVWEPFKEPENSSLRRICGRIAFILSDARPIPDYLQGYELDPRFSIPLCIDGLSNKAYYDIQEFAQEKYRNRAKIIPHIEMSDEILKLRRMEEEVKEQIAEESLEHLKSLHEAPQYLRSMGKRLQLDFVARIISGRKPGQSDWLNVLCKVFYEFDTGWHYYLILVIAGVLSLISVGYMGWNIYHSQTLLSYWNVFLGILIFAIIYDWFIFLTSSLDLSGDPDEFLLIFILGVFIVPFSIFADLRYNVLDLKDLVLLPFMAWAPAVGYFTTAFLLNFVSWLVAALIWVIIIGGCISLAVIGSRKEARSKNPLKGILDVHGISK